MRLLPIAAIVLLGLVPAACKKERKVDVAAGLDPSHMPTMKTVNVSTLISDSGVTRYKIVAPVWYIYDEADTPYWHFPQGVYLRKYDDKFRVIASVAADSARYFKLQKLWRLDGNVELTKEPADLFLTEQLFWNERTRTIYSDSFIHVENAAHIIEGHGFQSDDNLTSYTVVRPTGIFPAERSRLRGDAEPQDSARQPRTARTAPTPAPTPEPTDSAQQ